MGSFFDMSNALKLINKDKLRIADWKIRLVVQPPARHDAQRLVKHLGSLD